MPRLLKRVTLLFVLLLVLPIFAAWIYIAQPSFHHGDAASVMANQANLKTDVVKLSRDFFPRNYLHPKNLNACANYISRSFAANGAETSLQSFQVAGKTYANVIGRFGDPHPAKGRWIIGAHYDSCGDTPGADDNASGVAGLIELSRLLGNMKKPPPVELVAYTLEEPPFFRSENMGSAHHAKSLASSGVPTRGVLILEMIGYFDDRSGSQKYPVGLLKLFYPSRGDFLIVVGQLAQREFTLQVKIGMKDTSSLPVYSVNAPLSLPGIDFSDHLNYWEQGLQAVMITDTSFYRNKNYHGPRDTAERLDYRRMADGVTAIFQALLRLDGLEK